MSNRTPVGRDAEGNIIYAEDSRAISPDRTFVSRQREEHVEREARQHPRVLPRSNFSSGMDNFLERLKNFFVGFVKHLPQVLAVLLYILTFFTDSDGSVKLLMIIPCGIVFFTGWKGLIGLVVLVGLVQAC